MAGTLKRRRGLYMQKESIVRELAIEHNNVVDDLETLRANSRQMITIPIENLGGGADISKRGHVVMPRASTVLDSVKAVFSAATSGVDGSNTLVIELFNITEDTAIASVTKTATNSANSVESLTLVSAAADVAANDVIGVSVTQGATADAGIFTLQFEIQPQAIDAASDMTAAKLGDDAGNEYTE